jgi:hypothetical protein
MPGLYVQTESSDYPLHVTGALTVVPSTDPTEIINTSDTPLFVISSTNDPVYIVNTSQSKLYVQATSDAPLFVKPTTFLANTSDTPLFVKPTTFVTNTTANPLYVLNTSDAPIHIAGAITGGSGGGYTYARAYASAPSTAVASEGEVLIDPATAIEYVADSSKAWQVLSRPNSSTNPEYVKTNTRKKVTGTVSITSAETFSAGDVLTSTGAGAIIQFECNTILSAGQGGVILNSVAVLGTTALFIASGGGYALHLFSVSPTLSTNNAAFSIVTTDAGAYIGKIDISALALYVDGTTGCAAVTDAKHNLDFTLDAADTKLYAKICPKTTELTVAGKTLTVNLGIAAL